MIRTNITRTTRSLLVPARKHNFHSSPASLKTVTEKIKETASTVNKKVGEGLATAIDKGEQVTEATKQTVGSTAKQSADKSQELGSAAKQKANQAAAGAYEAKEDFKKEVKK